MDKAIIEEIIDQLYTCYESEISLQTIAYIHPMFYNGTFSENNSYQPTKPDQLLTKEEFIIKLNNESPIYRWNTAFQVLFNYMVKHKK